MAGSGSSMMAPPVLEGVAQSGFGITLSGFHCPVIEFGKRLAEASEKIHNPWDIVSHEENGYVTVLMVARESSHIPVHRTVSTYRREPHKFFQDLPKFLLSTKAQFVDRLILSGSLGSISLTLLYRPAEAGA